MNLILVKIFCSLSKTNQTTLVPDNDRLSSWLTKPVSLGALRPRVGPSVPIRIKSINLCAHLYESSSGELPVARPL